jgi:hypothetical protein
MVGKGAKYPTCLWAPKYVDADRKLTHQQAIAKRIFVGGFSMSGSGVPEGATATLKNFCLASFNGAASPRLFVATMVRNAAAKNVCRHSALMAALLIIFPK